MKMKWFRILLFLVYVGGVEVDAVSLPSVEVMAWIESDEYRWKAGNEMELQGITHNKTTYVIPGDIIGLVINCNATYPIQWDYTPDENLDPNIMVFSLYSVPRREGDNSPGNPMIFSMKLFIWGETSGFTGKYTCRRTGNDVSNGVFGDLSTELYLFWEGNSPPYIMGSGTTVKVSSYNKGSVILPCPVSFPETDIFLQKKFNVSTFGMSNITHEELVPVNTNSTIKVRNPKGVLIDKIVNVTTYVKQNITKEINVTVSSEMKYLDVEFNTNTTAVSSITYDPSFGFVLDNTIDKNKSIDGEYKCMSYEKDDFKIFNVTSDPPVVKDNPKIDKLDRGTSISFNTSTQLLQCCSNSDKPPVFYVFYCISYVHCEIALPLLYHNQIEKLNQYYYGQGKGNGNCVTTWLYPGGAYRCKGDGIDVSRVIFTNNYVFNNTNKRDLYWSWSEINGEHQQRLIHLFITANQIQGIWPWWYKPSIGMDPNTILYTGQNISFNCQPALFYYSDGVQWKIKWKNNTETKLKIPAPKFEPWHWYYTPPKSANIVIDPQIHSVVCSAPIWNSTEWVQKEFIVKSRDPTTPVIHSPDSENIYWTLNETDVSIRCEGTGDPIPGLRWLKNGKLLQSGTEKGNILLEPGNGSLTLKFKMAEYNTHGSYLCIAENLKDKTEKMFNVYVEEGHPWTATIVITCIVLGFLTVLGILGWRLKINHDTASELRWRTS